MKKFEELSWEERETIMNNAKEELLKGIELEPLYEEIRKVVNDSSIQFTSEIVEYRNDKYIGIKSEELISKIGMMGVALKSVRLETFNSSLAYDKEEQKAYWWGSIDFRYEIAEGGSNGIKVLKFWFKDGQYEFKTAR